MKEASSNAGRSEQSGCLPRAIPHHTVIRDNKIAQHFRDIADLDHSRLNLSSYRPEGAAVLPAAFNAANSSWDSGSGGTSAYPQYATSVFAGSILIPAPRLRFRVFFGLGFDGSGSELITKRRDPALYLDVVGHASKLAQLLT